MRAHRSFVTHCCALLIAPAVHPALADDHTVDLLRLPGARPVTEISVASDVAAVPALFDNDRATVAIQAVDGSAPWNLVFDFGEVATASRLTLRLPPSSPAPARADVLVSSTSPGSGYRSLKNEPVDGLADQVAFDLPPQGARWLMLRLYPAPGATSIAVADLAVEGHTGLPETRYAFGESPAAAISILKGLASLDAAGFALSNEEAAIFAKAQAGPLSDADFEAAALLASGVNGAEQLANYRGLIDRLEQQARAELDLSGSRAKLGAELLVWLHSTALASGYVAHQTDLSVLLDEGTFNCVSSAVLYAALGRRLGLDVRGIEVPDHAFAILYDGADHMDVETTTAGGFNPSRERVAEFEALTGFNYIPEAHRDRRREIDGAGMAALIAYNHGVGLLKEGRFREAILANFRAMSLDPEFTSAATNALAGLGRWSEDLAAKGAWEDAASIAALGVRLAPADRGLAQAQLAVWQGWAKEIAGAGRPGDAVALLRNAPPDISAADLAMMEATLFLRPAEDLVAEERWTAALDTVGAGLPLVSDAARQELEDWRRGLFVRWANTAIDQRRYAEAADVLARALVENPQSDTYPQMVRYLAQEQAAAAADYASGLAALQEIKARFPEAGGWDEVAEAYVLRNIEMRQSTQTINESVGLAEGAGTLLSVEGRTDLVAHVFELYGHAAIDRSDWMDAATIYAAGLARVPAHPLLTQNARYAAQEWQRAVFAEGGVNALAEVNGKLRILFPGLGTATDGAAVQHRLSELLAEKAFDAADALLDDAQLVLSPVDYEEYSVASIDGRARGDMETGDFAAAARAYSTGLRRWPENRILNNNTVYLAQEWMRGAEAEGGAEAVLTAKAALDTLFPQNEDIAEVTLATLRRAVDARIASGAFGEARRILAVTRPALNQEDVEALAAALFNGMARARMQAGDWSGAVDALAEGLGVVPGSGDLKKNAAFVAQEWTAETLAHGDPGAFIAASTAVRQAFPEVRAIADVLTSVVGRAVQELADAGTEEQALELIRQVQSGLSNDGEVQLTEYVYDRWARRLGDEGDWSGALEVYDKGLADVPESGLLLNNRKVAASKQ